MKLIPLKELPDAKTLDVIRGAVKYAPPVAPGQTPGFDNELVLSHARILKALRTKVTPAGLVLEDADHKTLVEAIRKARYTEVSEGLAEIIDDIKEAKEAPAAANLAPQQQASA